MSDYDNVLQIDDLNEIATIQGAEREQRMEKMLEKILEKLEQIERQMLRELRSK